jgi:hypothetical protein
MQPRHGGDHVDIHHPATAGIPRVRYQFGCVYKCIDGESLAGVTLLGVAADAFHEPGQDPTPTIGHASLLRPASARTNAVA